MNDQLAANRYAQALFELARAERRDQAVEEKLAALSQALKADPSLEKRLLSPHLTPADKKKIVGMLYGQSKDRKILLRFLGLLIGKGRLYLIHQIAEGYKSISDFAQGEALAEITTAFELDAAKEKTLAEKLEKMAGSKLVIKKTVDPSLIGGVLVKIRNRVYDGSVRGNLERLKKELIHLKTV